ncbi:hypothetical protein DPMN_180240 [Dreissena polymorpha]|uniref:Uncharacterized protein n=1 Tax=Dreissena polymorpha TaxID=45954 RepID=A0A9D4EGK5_DREPO|nr:hypothetical protein DPMN_180240 [Dreissena polymorpha]
MSDDKSRTSCLEERRDSSRRISIKADAVAATEDNHRLNQLYSLAIQTVQCVDNTLPMGDRRLSFTRGPKVRGVIVDRYKYMYRYVMCESSILSKHSS